MKLSKQLVAIGYQGTPEQFRYLLLSKFAELFPAETDEQLLIHPTTQAIPFCHAIVRELGLAIPEDLILSTLINARKRGIRLEHAQ